ncbi:hypothetical protein FNF28_01609 [Cafeteria roenbergensis]|uniref:FAD-binding FR-type domain-containing protein n=1 Tax=Cafeteria roenbergensis TaxID=33653 RepID=A0A5A8DY91_CAFRO|nr:hypothetical protein FNF28_01609 [Cafeteria roenbergensis]
MDSLSGGNALWAAIGAAGAATAAVTWTHFRSHSASPFLADPSRKVAPGVRHGAAAPASRAAAAFNGDAKSPLEAVIGELVRGDAAFVYDFEGEDVASIARAARGSSSAPGAEVVTGLGATHGRPGALVRGAVSAGLARVGVLAEAAAAPSLLPMLEDIAKDGHVAVLHVASTAAHPSSLAAHSSPHVALRAAAALHRNKLASTVPIVSSGDTAREALLGARLAQQLATRAGKPALHTFGSGPTSFSAPTSDFVGGEEVGAAAVPSFFSFVGHPQAETVAVTLATGSSSLAGAVSLLAAAGERVGLVRIRVLRPWSSRQFLAALPSSARALVVVLPDDDAGAPAASSLPPCSPHEAAPLQSWRGVPLTPGLTSDAVSEVVAKRRLALAAAVESARSKPPLRSAQPATATSAGSAAAAAAAAAAGSTPPGSPARSATASASPLARQALLRSGSLPALPGNRVGASSAASVASTFARAADAATSEQLAYGSSGGGAGSRAGARGVPIPRRETSPSALLAALVDAAASARSVGSEEASGSLSTSLLIIPADGEGASYLAGATGLRLAVEGLGASDADGRRLWAAVVRAADSLGGRAAVSVLAGPLVGGTGSLAVRAALSVAGAPERTGGLLASSGVSVSDAGAVQRTTLVVLAQLKELLTGADSAAAAAAAQLTEVAALVAVLAVPAVVLVAEAALAAVGTLNCGDGASGAGSEPRARRSAPVALVLGEAAPEDVIARIVEAAGDDVRTSAVPAYAAVFVIPAGGRPQLAVDGGHAAALRWAAGLDGASTLSVSKLRAALARAESAVVQRLEESDIESTDEGGSSLSKPAFGKSSLPSVLAPGGWGSEQSLVGIVSESKDSDSAGEPDALIRGGKPSQPEARAQQLVLKPPAPRLRDAVLLSDLLSVTLSRQVIEALAGSSDQENAPAVAPEQAATALGLVPPPPPVRVQARDLQVPRHVALPFMFPEAFHAEAAPRPAEQEKLWLATVSRKVRLTPEDYSRNVFHIEFDIPEGLRYEMGEALGVYGHNCSADVDDFLEWYGLNGSDVVTMPSVGLMAAAGNLDLPAGYGETTTISRAFTQMVDIFGRVTKQFLENLGAYATDADERTQLFFLTTPEGKAAFKALIEETATVADLLQRFPSAHPPVHDLLAIVPPIRPRHYSIASSQQMHPRSVHLLVVTVEWKDSAGRRRMGHCTRYMDAAQPGDTVVVSVKPSVMKLPRDPKAPVIMAGLGTGMAPFRAFIEERAVQKRRGEEVGPLVLYFGSRYRAKEYLYGDELEAYEREGVLTRQRLAFSRDQDEKVYIQHLMEQDGADLARWLHSQAGSFYLCGPTWPEGPVQDAMEAAFSAHAGVDGAAEVRRLKDAERYILEVY